MKSKSVAKLNAIITFPTSVKIHFVCFTVTGSFLITIHQSIELARKIKEEDKPGSRGCHLASDSGPRGTSGRKPEASQSNGMRTAHRLGMRPIYDFFFLQIFFPAEDRIFSKEICSQNSEIRGNEEEFYALIHFFGQFVRFSQGNSNCQTNEW